MNVTFSGGVHQETLRIDSPEGEIGVLVHVHANGDVGIQAFRYGEVIGPYQISQLIPSKRRVPTPDRPLSEAR